MSIKERYRGFKPLPADIQQRIGLLPPLLEKEGVLLTYLFGSLAQRNYGEDVDLAVLHKYELDQLRVLLVEHLGTQRIDLIDLKRAPLYLCMGVLRNGKLIYRQNVDVENSFEMKVLRAYQDAEPIRKLQHEILKRSLGL